MTQRTPQYHPDHAAPPGGQHVSLRSTEAVYALLDLLGNHEQVHALVASYPTWDRLAAASPAELGHYVGLRGAQLNIPRTCPPLPGMPAGVQLRTRYSLTYPHGVRDLTDPPTVLFVAGTLPDEPMLGIGGAENPTMVGVEISRAAALSATIQHVPVVAQVTPGCSLNALRTAVDSGGRVVAVMSHGFAVTSSQQVLLEQVLDAGGAVVTEVPPGVTSTEQRVDAAARLVTGLSSAVLLAEVGTHRAAGQAIAASAVRAGRFTIVPAPDAAPESGRYIAPSAFGSAVFASAKEWSPDYFGTGPRIEYRCANGLPPADQVVANPAELAAAIALGCRADTRS